MNYIHISFAGPSYRIIDTTGKEWYFEWHRYCGPIDLKKDGDPKKVQPANKSDFWIVISQWAQQGKKSKDGYCIYDKNIPLRHAEVEE